MKKYIILIIALLILQQTYSQTNTDKMDWWREARLGMFVHWGLYSAAAGEWKGQTFPNTGGQEWIQSLAGVSTAEYEKVLKPLFKPEKGFAESWVELAKAAGCKYLVFTTKHHEGFALHASKVTDFDAKDFTGRDLVKEIVEACRKGGLKIGFYYSLVDWHHPDAYVGMGLPRIKGDTNEGRVHEKYVDFMHAQVDELVSNYGDIDVLWWDYSSEQVQGEKWGAKSLMANVREKQPHIIMNNRLYAKVKTGVANADGYDRAIGDFVTPEQKIPATGLGNVDWETCMTINNTWGYSKFDDHWKSTKTLIRNTVDIASKGGNYLINIGPKADGSIPQASVDRMRELGEWMKINGESIYGTTASPFPNLSWGLCTQKGDKLYLHVFDWPEDNKLEVPLLNGVKSAYLLSNPQTEFKVEKSEGKNIVSLSGSAPDSIVSVVVLEIEGAPKVVPDSNE